MNDRYYYSRLSTKEQCAYRDIVFGLTRLAARIKVPFGVDVGRVLVAINYDNPQLYFVKFDEIDTVLNFSGTRYLPAYYFSRKECLAINARVNKQCQAILRQVQGRCDHEKVVSLHDLLAGKVRYDADALNDRARTPFSSTILGVLLEKRAVCEGVAKACKLLLNALNIKCMVACGKLLSARDEGHAWNIVKIAGQPVHLDITNDLDVENTGFVRHTYCCISDRQIEKTHRMNEVYPACLTTEYDYFVQNSANVFEKCDIQRMIRRACQAGKGYAEFRVKNDFLTEEEITQTALKAVLDCTARCSVQLQAQTDREQGVYLLRW